MTTAETFERTCSSCGRLTANAYRCDSCGRNPYSPSAGPGPRNQRNSHGRTQSARTTVFGVLGVQALLWFATFAASLSANSSVDSGNANAFPEWGIAFVAVGIPLLVMSILVLKGFGSFAAIGLFTSFLAGIGLIIWLYALLQPAVEGSVWWRAFYEGSPRRLTAAQARSRPMPTQPYQHCCCGCCPGKNAYGSCHGGCGETDDYIAPWNSYAVGTRPTGRQRHRPHRHSRDEHVQCKFAPGGSRWVDD